MIFPFRKKTSNKDDKLLHNTAQVKVYDVHERRIDDNYTSMNQMNEVLHGQKLELESAY